MGTVPVSEDRMPSLRHLLLGPQLGRSMDKHTRSYPHMY